VLDIAALDSDQMLARLNMIADRDQHFGYRSRCSRANQQNVACAFYAP
jgi:hypothetical protein